ncbi:MAG: hypothetical protein HZB26_14340 [Candidatus Hydrogenedentes bacterium]|nr:hypothetical protein [Candidatus Hydrogenedentota bacterium]
MDKAVQNTSFLSCSTARFAIFSRFSGLIARIALDPRAPGAKALGLAGGNP